MKLLSIFRVVGVTCKFHNMKRSLSPTAEKSAKVAKFESLNKYNVAWQNYGEPVKGLHPVMCLDGPSVLPSNKIAAFDLDWTLIKTKTGKAFPTSSSDWVFWDGKVASKLTSLHNDGYKIVIFSNQGGLEKKKTKPQDIKEKLTTIMKRLGFAIQVFISTGENIYRKPYTGLWDLMIKKYNGDIAVDLNSSYYVGDAAGRPKGWAPGSKKDFSCSDRKFAANINVKFYTPEEYFNKAKPYTKFEWGSIDPKKVLEENCAQNYEELASKETEMIIMVGLPSSGKSTFSKRYLEPNGYVLINRDTLKTQEKCLKVAQEKLSNKVSVVIDNTNPSKDARKAFIDIARKKNIPVRCFHFDTSLEVANHLNMYRQLQTQGKVRRIPAVGYNVFKSKFQLPDKTEGFSEIKKMKFSPNFENEDQKKMFLQWT